MNNERQLSKKPNSSNGRNKRMENERVGGVEERRGRAAI